MPDDLQGLLDRIQKDGVAKADAEAAEILARAKAKAAERVKAAEAEAKALRDKAEAEAKQFVERGTVTLRQAARDLLLSLGRGLEALLDQAILRSVDAALDPNTLKSLLVKVVEAYAAQGLAENRLAVLLSPEDHRTLGAAIQAELRTLLKEQVVVQPDERLSGGFTLSVQDGRVEYDLSPAALADAIGALLKPPLSEIVRRAAESASGTPT